jgi:hypothetical protein
MHKHFIEESSRLGNKDYPLCKHLSCLKLLGIKAVASWILTISKQKLVNFQKLQCSNNIQQPLPLIKFHKKGKGEDCVCVCVCVCERERETNQKVQMTEKANGERRINIAVSKRSKTRETYHQYCLHQATILMWNSDLSCHFETAKNEKCFSGSEHCSWPVFFGSYLIDALID